MTKKGGSSRMYWAGFCPKCKGELRTVDEPDGSRKVFCKNCGYVSTIRQSREKAPKVRINGKEVAFRF